MFLFYSMNTILKLVDSPLHMIIWKQTYFHFLKLQKVLPAGDGWRLGDEKLLRWEVQFAKTQCYVLEPGSPMAQVNVLTTGWGNESALLWSKQKCCCKGQPIQIFPWKAENPGFAFHFQLQKGMKFP